MDQTETGSGTFKAKPKSRRRRKIRSLAVEVPETKSLAYKCKRLLIIAAVLVFFTALLAGHYYTNEHTKDKHLLKEFIRNYHRQYAQIVNGKTNYCDQSQPIDTKRLYERMQDHRILHQEKALLELMAALKNDTVLNAIAFVGPSGVGKSLVASTMAEMFPWQENIKSYAWNTFVDNEEDKFKVLHLMIDNLSECGQNLLIIENLTPYNRDIVTRVNDLLAKSIAMYQQRIIVLYLYSLNTMLSPQKYEDQKSLFHSMPECRVIEFNSINKHELEDCIRREANMENLTLTGQDFDEIVDTIDPAISGCKNVNAKVLMYGTIKANKTKVI